MPAGDDRDERRDERGAKHLPEDDHLRQRERDDRHHEGEHRPERRALAEKGLDDRDDARGVGVHRDAEQHRERHGPPGAAPHERRQEVRRDVAVDARADRDAGDDVEPDLADDLANRSASVLQTIRATLVPVSGATLPDWTCQTQGSTCRSSFRRPMIQPATIAIARPVPR